MIFRTSNVDCQSALGRGEGFAGVSSAVRVRSGFTLNELLIVIAIIVLMLGLAVPTFNVLSGSKSVEGATNQISAVLGQARAEAIGVQEIRGVLFFIDPATDRVNLAIVRDSGYDNGDGVTYLNLVPNREFATMPSGVMVQTLNNPAAGTNRTTDGYIGFNTAPGNAGAGLPIITKYGGVILFDGSGKLVSTRYGFRCSETSTSQTGPVTDMASLLSQGRVNGTGTGTDFAVNPATIYSQIGLALFQRAGFETAGYTMDDAIITGTTYGTYVSTAPDAQEADEEVWIDNNSLVQLVNRYNGTLIKAE